jgi:hypothetical protein
MGVLQGEKSSHTRSTQTTTGPGPPGVNGDRVARAVSARRQGLRYQYCSLTAIEKAFAYLDEIPNGISRIVSARRPSHACSTLSKQKWGWCSRCSDAGEQTEYALKEHDVPRSGGLDCSCKVGVGYTAGEAQRLLRSEPTTVQNRRKVGSAGEVACSTG